MNTPRFDPSRSIVVDLAHGQLMDDEGTARLNLPAHHLVRLCEQAGEAAARDFSMALGTDLGRRIVDRLGDLKERASVEDWVEHLGGQLALVGLGDLTSEQWGKALVLRVKGSPKGLTQIISNVLTGALSRALGRAVAMVPFERNDDAAFLVLSPASARKIQQLAHDGVALGQAIDQLHEGAA
jgi:hypothetical protein